MVTKDTLDNLDEKERKEIEKTMDATHDLREGLKKLHDKIDSMSKKELNKSYKRAMRGV